MNPEDIARMITEDPDVFNEDKCPICGSEGYAGFTSFSCPNPSCSNYDRGAYPTPTRKLKADRYIVYGPEWDYSVQPDKSNEWLIGFEYDDGKPRTLWALEKDGKYMGGKEFDKWIGHVDHYGQEASETAAFYRLHGFGPSEAQDQPMILNDQGKRRNGWWDDVVQKYELS